MNYFFYMRYFGNNRINVFNNGKKEHLYKFNIRGFTIQITDWGNTPCLLQDNKAYLTCYRLNRLKTYLILYKKMYKK